MRVVCLSCIDGRIHDAVFRGVRDLYADAVIDLITEPGLDGCFFKNEQTRLALLSKVDLSLEVNASKALICVGHYDCKGNPVSSKEHCSLIEKMLFFFRKFYPQLACHGLWINEKRSFEAIEI